ncbi:MAG: hypothetical protein WC438_05625 [Candidatus Pacearchaeota archaeon]
MTYFKLVENKDVFVTRVEANPEYNFNGNLTISTGSVYFYFCGTIQSEYVYRDYYNTGSTYHTYYYVDGSPILKSTASISFYNGVDTSSNIARTIKNLDDFYFVSESCGSGSGFYGSKIDIISIPRVYFGNKFKNFMTIESDPIHGKRIIYDDGRGNVFFENCTTKCGPFLVGKAFYNEGLIYVRSDPSLIGHAIYYSWINSESICTEIMFTGSYNIYVQNVFCHIPAYQANFSQNETAYITASNGEQVKLYSGSDDRIFITGIGLYDEDYNHIATAKISKGVRKKPSDNVLIKLRLDT